MSSPKPRCADLDDLPLVLTVPQVANHLQVSATTVRELCRRGELRHVRVGRFIRVPLPALATFLGLRDSGESEIETVSETRDQPALRVAQ